MAKRGSKRAARVFEQPARRGYAGTRPCPSRVDVTEQALKRAAQWSVTRRGFITRLAGAGLTLSLPPLLAGCSDSDGGGGGPPALPALETRTLFFNFSHENHAAKRYFMIGGGQKYALVRIGDKPGVLAEARKANAFLRAVPDDQITHHVEGAVFAADSVTICYAGADLDTAAGTWSMSSVFLNIPQSGASHAYARARARTPSGPLPMSAKRTLYGAPAAQTEQDLRDERALVDVATQAATIIGAGPDLMSLEPDSAHHVQSNHIDTSIGTVLLANKLRQAQYGPATPEQTPGRINAAGWATLAPVIDDTTGQPFRNQKGKNAGRIQYQPQLNPDLATLAAGAMTGATQAVKDDTSLGADITNVAPSGNAPGLSGALWLRHDGATHVDQSPGQAVRDQSVVMTLKQQGPQNGLSIGATASQAGSANPQVSLTMKNWYVRFLGVWLQFLDDKDPPNVLALASMPEYRGDTIIVGHKSNDPDKLDTDYEMFVGMLGAEFTILGIPAWPGSLAPSFAVPTLAHTVKVLASGLGAGANNYPDTLLPGAIMTGIVNFGVTAILSAMGAAVALQVITQTIIVPLATYLAQELIAGFSSALAGKDAYSPDFWKAQGLGLAKFIINFVVGKAVGFAVGKLAGAIVGAAAEGVAEDEIPVAGWLMMGISVAVGEANLIQTSVEVASSPWTYENDLVFTHDLAVTVQPDPNDDTFPKAADHYRVTALFDDGTPHVQTLALPAPAPRTLPPVTFTGVPLGGQVNVSVSFYQAAPSAAQTDTLLGKGTTGLVPNTAADSVPPFAINEIKFPIGPGTVYKHKQKTAVDAATGNHKWDTAAPAPTVNAGNTVCGGAGTICGWRSITVRQGRSNPPQNGYVGYVWQAQNSDPSKAPSCQGAGVGQLDQMANLNTADAQAGYLATSCGFNRSGVRLAYDLLSSGGANFYLDTTDPNALHLRQVMLEPAPQFDGPLSNRSWGVLNFLPDALLLHPAGHLVSISSVVHKLETHKLPRGPRGDADAKVHLLAHASSGKGTRPGLMTAPTTAAVAPDGTILVVEAGDAQASPPVPNRIQAFDLGANPVQFFAKQPQAYFLVLADTPAAQGWQHLDVAVEFSGFIYLLSYNQNTLVYRLDVYHPQQSGTSPVSTTTGINAARLAVDFWRNVYTLNYEVLQLPGAGVTEPTVSLWVPSNSCTGVNCAQS